nr:MAG TPA: hypothetical protein [Caudoviricetes sp.]
MCLMLLSENLMNIYTFANCFGDLSDLLGY